MAKILSQQEIDAVVNAVRRGQTDGGTVQKERSVQPCNFRTAGQLSNEHARSITSLHETFARSVTNSLGAYLRASFEMTLASVEQLSFLDYAASMPETGYSVPLQLNQMNACALLQVDLDLVYPMIDLLLGGDGTPVKNVRTLTEIDEDVMDSVTSLISRQIENTWKTLSVAVTVLRPIKPEQVRQFYSATEKMLVLTFEAKTSECHGAVNLLVPASFANWMLRQISADPSKQKVHIREFARPTMGQRLMDCDFVATVGLPSLRVPVRDLLALAPGTVLKLKRPVSTSAALTIEGREVFEAQPVRSGTQRAAQLTRQLAQTSSQDVR